MKKSTVISLLLILLVGLIPVLWFGNGILIFGHDAGLPFDPTAHFLDRFHVWSQRFGIGTDQSAALLGAFFIHGFEYLLDRIPLSLQVQQMLQFIFWFTLPGLTMYFFTSKTWPEKKYLPAAASIIYMLNYFLIQGWFIAERTKFSLYAALPLVMYFMLSYLTKKMSAIPAILLSGLTLFFLNGGGSFPLYGGMIIVFGLTYLYLLFLRPSIGLVLRIGIYTVGTGILYGLLNAYWIAPYLYYVSSFYSRDLANAGGAEGVLTWATYLTQGSNLINLLIGQGIPEWYLNEFHPYAATLLKNPLFILGSFLFLSFFAASFFIVKKAKDKFYLYLFALIGLTAIIFSAGPNSPFGFIYEFCVRYIPGFAMFRSSYYKFNYAQWFAFSVIISFSIEYFLHFLEKRKNKYILPFGIITLLVFYLLYHYPVLTGLFFDYNQNPDQKISMRLHVPEYIFTFSDWVNQQDPNMRFLILPELNDSAYISYQWGYWSLAPINSLSNRNSFVQNSSLVPESGRLLMKEMYAALRNRKFNDFSDYLHVFAIDKIVLQKDVDYKNAAWGTTDPAVYEQILKESGLFTKEKEFGNWVVYRFNDDQKNLRISASHNVGYLQGELKHIVSFPAFDPTAPLFMGGLEGAASDAYYQQEATDLFITGECIECDSIETGFTFELYNPKLLPGSPFYPVVKINEERVEQRANDFRSKVNFYLTTANRRVVEMKWMIDTGNSKEFLQETIERYHQALQRLNSVLNESNTLSQAEKNDIYQTIYGNLLTEQSIIKSFYDSTDLTLQNRLTLDEVYSLVLAISEKAENEKFITKSLSEKNFLLTLPIDGEYSVYIKRTVPGETNEALRQSTLRINNQELPATAVEGEWVSYGEVPLEKGELHATLSDTSAVNIATTSAITFPFGRSGIISDDDTYTFNNASLNECITLQIPGDDPSVKTEYKIQFDYKHELNEKSLYVYSSYGENKIPVLRSKDSFLPVKQEWSTYMNNITPLQSGMSYNICNGYSFSDSSTTGPWTDSGVLKYGYVQRSKSSHENTTQPIATVSNISLQKITYPSLLLYKENKQKNNTPIPFTYTKIDPVTYNISFSPTTEPSSVVMRESYGKYWQACWEDGECFPFDDKAHFSSAGFANAWYFKDGLKNHLRLYYYPQVLYKYGAILSGITFLLTGGVLCVFILRKK